MPVERYEEDLKISATTTNQSKAFAKPVSRVYIYTTADVHLTFGAALSTDSFLLKNAAGVWPFEGEFSAVNVRTVSSTATVYVKGLR